MKAAREAVKRGKMRRVQAVLTHFAEAVAATMMALLFVTFIVQIVVRYSARLEWLPHYFPFLDPTLYGWTLEFCLLMWVWIVFWGNAFIVRQRDHVIFDIVYTNVSPTVRMWSSHAAFKTRSA